MNKKRKKKGDAGVLSWIVNIILLEVLPPVGVILLIARFFGKDYLESLLSTILNSVGGSGSSTQSGTTRTTQTYEPNSSSRSRAARAGYTAAGSGQVNWERVRAEQNDPYASQQPAQEVKTEKPEAEKAKKKAKEDDGIAHISKGKKALFICGWILIAVAALNLPDSLRTTLWDVMGDIAFMLGGAGMLFTAHIKDKKERLYQNCVKIIGGKASMDLESLSRAAGVNSKTLVRELDEMLERGYFPPAAYLDNAHNMIVLDPDQVQTAPPPVQPDESTDGEAADKFDLLMQELDRACGRIQDRDMLEKSVQIRGLTAAIFHAVRENPEKEGQISNFINFYFPTTLKLLDSYADFEAKGYQGEKLVQTKERIENTADTIIAAYQKQLDNLYLSDTLDVDTDIDVLETMLKRDGLSESDFGQTGMPGV